MRTNVAYDGSLEDEAPVHGGCVVSFAAKDFLHIKEASINETVTFCCIDNAHTNTIGKGMPFHCTELRCTNFLGRLPKVDLIILEGGNVCPYVRTSVRPSTKSFFDFNEIWYVGRGR